MHYCTLSRRVGRRQQKLRTLLLHHHTALVTRCTLITSRTVEREKKVNSVKNRVEQSKYFGLKIKVTICGCYPVSSCLLTKKTSVIQGTHCENIGTHTLPDDDT